jgi:hypothetical protein
MRNPKCFHCTEVINKNRTNKKGKQNGKHT